MRKRIFHWFHRFSKKYDVIIITCNGYTTVKHKNKVLYCGKMSFKNILDWSNYAGYNVRIVRHQDEYGTTHTSQLKLHGRGIQSVNNQ